MAQKILLHHYSSRADYSGFQGLPLGCGVEVLCAGALFEADRLAVKDYDREHVSPFLYTNPDIYRISRPYAEEALCVPESRVTLDTPEDYSYICSIFDSLYEGKPVDIWQLAAYLKKNRN
jgi:spore coat polysaccharide biosynthesis protein SpsF